MNKRRRLLITGTLLLAAAVPAADAAYLLLKAQLAQILIAQAWDETSTSPKNFHSGHVKAWPWADTHPVARLKIDNLDLDTWVLNGSSGTSLAFGAGLNEGSAAIGDNGLVMIGAHRDTHFKNLDRIKVGHAIRLQDTDRQWHTYHVTHIGIADSRIDSLPVIEDAARLALITCYPFNTLSVGGPLRFVVEAQKVG